MSNIDLDVKAISEAPVSEQERYGLAINASNLRVRADDHADGAPRILIAAAMSPDRLGAALMRLVSEWDGSEKPRHPSRDDTLAVFKSLKPGYIPFVYSPAERQRREESDNKRRHDFAPQMTYDWYMHELKLLCQKLKTLPEVCAQVIAWVREQGIADAERRAAEVLNWWLHHVCPACNGRKKEHIPGSPSLSHRDCQVCKGSGMTRVPHGLNDSRGLVESWKILRHLNYCVAQAQGSLKVRLRGMRARIQKGVLND
jgi:hypothetical protein